ncbi:MAG: NAD-dependent epimerase/dehydratase family protein [Candidatus Omnitrophota bacterium]
MQGKRVVVTGGTGFVGANLVRRLLRDGHRVCLLVRHNYDPWRIEEIRADIEIREVDLGDRPAVTQAVGEIRPAWVFHLAAYGAYSWQKHLPMMVRTNIVSTINLVQACHKSGCEVFVNTGSSSEYGSQDHACTEDELPQPKSHYAVTKLGATVFCQSSARGQKMLIPTLRLYSVYGPFEDPFRLLPALILNGLRGRLPPLVDPAAAHDFVYIDDVIDAYVLAAKSPLRAPGAVYNVGSGTQVSLREAVAIARRLMPVAQEPVWGSMQSRGRDERVWIADTGKIRRELGWTPRYTFEEGFSAFITWFTREPARVEAYRKRINAHGAPARS